MRSPPSTVIEMPTSWASCSRFCAVTTTSSICAAAGWSEQERRGQCKWAREPLNESGKPQRSLKGVMAGCGEAVWRAPHTMRRNIAGAAL